MLQPIKNLIMYKKDGIVITIYHVQLYSVERSFTLKTEYNQANALFPRLPKTRIIAFIKITGFQQTLYGFI